MKKLKKLPSQPQDMFRKLNELIDLVNSQQEAIEKLEKVITRDTVRIVTDDIIDALLEPADDKPVDNEVDNKKTHVDDTRRTVTLRIPKGMTVGEIFEEIDNTYDWARWGGRWFGQLKDEEVKILFDEVTQKALDEVQPNE